MIQTEAMRYDHRSLSLIREVLYATGMQAYSNAYLRGFSSHKLYAKRPTALLATMVRSYSS